MDQRIQDKVNDVLTKRGFYKPGTKQVIVIRTKYPDGKGGTRTLRRGKEIAQCSHASMSFLTRPYQAYLQRFWLWRWLFRPNLTLGAIDWLKSGFTKICVQVDSEDQLLDIYERAKQAGLESHIVMDSGKTEFGGIPTYTAVAIGPNYSGEIDKITGNLKLY